MIELNVSIEIACPAAEIWQIIADFGQDPRWRAGVTTMAPDPPGLVVPGTTTDEFITFRGRVHYTGSVVTSVTPGREFAWRTISGIDAEGGRSVVPLGGDRCLVTVRLRVRFRGLRRLYAPFLGHALKHKLQQDVRRLSDLVIARA
ncbi:SRPBCC family protein [Streptosporangium amethystogenes subsp. fukuiense]|uniref:SRPBCC family protein n=1 Tax=Streptosporangium amethystogenes subsp. fukuiense TaxID=698418 RepID=A0ABW2TFT8_9ACTN